MSGDLDLGDRTQLERLLGRLEAPFADGSPDETLECGCPLETIPCGCTEPCNCPPLYRFPPCEHMQSRTHNLEILEWADLLQAIKSAEYKEPEMLATHPHCVKLKNHNPDSCDKCQAYFRAAQPTHTEIGTAERLVVYAERHAVGLPYHIKEGFCPVCQGIHGDLTKEDMNGIGRRIRRIRNGHPVQGEILINSFQVDEEDHTLDYLPMPEKRPGPKTNPEARARLKELDKIMSEKIKKLKGQRPSQVFVDWLLAEKDLAESVIGESENLRRKLLSKAG